MDKELYLIHLDDYLDHIDGKLEMYGLLLELVRSLRSDLEAVEDAQALRTLCAYEQKAHEMYENWGIPDSYTESGDPDDLGQLMEGELLPDDDDSVYDDSMYDDGEMSAACRLLRAVNGLTESTRAILDVTNEIAEFEDEIERLLDNSEGPENACAD